jgi:hypothetical protein
MSDHAFADDFGTALDESEMAEVVGGTSSILYAIGFFAGAVFAMVVQTATSSEMQPYCFGA